MARTFKEADLQAIGGLSPNDRRYPGVHELVELAAVSCKRFKEALAAGAGVRRWWEHAQTAVRSLREAESETALGFLLRKGVQTEANDWYRVAPAEWRNYCKTAGSTTLAEWYAPLYPTTIADRVMRGTRFPEARIVGEDSHLRNEKFGLIVNVERELFDDDQTGQIQDRARVLGESMAVTESVWASSRFLGAARTYANITVPVSDYSTTDVNGTAVTSPWSTTIYGSVGNRPTTYGILNMGHLGAAYSQLLNALDPLSNKLVVTPNCLLVSSMDALHGQVLLEPGPWPTVVGQSDGALATNPVLGGTTVGAIGTATGPYTGFPGGWGSANPFGKLGIKLSVERYLTDWAWALGESKKGIVMQIRDPLEIVQESPSTGSWFTFDSVQWRSRSRWIVDWIAGGSRFWYLGSDGTVTGTF